MAKVTIKAGESDFIINEVGDDGSPLFTTSSFQVAARKGTGSLTFKARASGSLSFEDILDSDGGVVGTLDFANPVIFKVINCSVNALQCDASGLADDAEIEITSL
jgi:hypothetical protein